MKKISSDLTGFRKRILPVFWFGLLGFIIVMMFASGAATKEPIVFTGPVIMIVVGFVVMRKLVWDLADEVYDCGDELLVRNRDEEERIKLSNIINVNASTMINPPRITLRLDKPGRFGQEVTFSPASQSLLRGPFTKSAIGEDLIVRVDRARRKP